MVVKVFSALFSYWPQRPSDAPALSLNEKAYQIYALFLKYLNAKHYLNLANRVMGNYIRDTYFLPLVNEPQVKEESYHDEFLDKNAPLDTNFPLQEAIREHFTFRQQSYTITLPDGQTLILSCPTFECTCTSEKQPYTYVHIAGNLTNGKNNILWFYPPLSAFLDKHRGKELPPARFILLSAYEMRPETNAIWRPEILEIAGYALAKALEQIGKHELTYATSLGVIYLSRALKYLPDHFIRYLCLDRGPTSLEEVSQIYWHKEFSLECARLGGWSFDVESALRSWNIKKQNAFILILGVEHDNLFPSAASLCNNAYLKELRGYLNSPKQLSKLTILKFDPPKQTTYSRKTHHALRVDLFNSRYLTDKSESTFFESGENLAHALIRTSMFPSDVLEKKQSL